MLKSFAGESCSRIAGEALQLHGGIGFTWEHDLHLYLRRIKADQALFGSVGWHRDALGRLTVDDGADGRVTSVAAAARHSERALGDQVANQLRRAARHGERARVKEIVLPTTLLRRPLVPFHEQRSRSLKIESVLGQLEVELAVGELPDRYVLWTLLAGGFARETSADEQVADLHSCGKCPDVSEHGAVVLPADFGGEAINSSSMSRKRAAPAPIPERSAPRLSSAIDQPCPSSPSSADAGIRTESRNTSLKSVVPVISRIGRNVDAGCAHREDERTDSRVA